MTAFRPKRLVLVLAKLAAVIAIGAAGYAVGTLWSDQQYATVPLAAPLLYQFVSSDS